MVNMINCDITPDLSIVDYTQPPAKRRRTFVTAGQKHAICQYKEMFPRVSIQAIMSWTKDNLGIELGRSTVSDILRDKDKWLAVDCDSNKLRCQMSQLPLLEDALFTWFQEMKANGSIPTDSMLLEKAKSIGDQFDVPANFTYSRGWLYKMKRRKKMTCNQETESTKVERNAILTGRMDFHMALESYELDDIYNLDETCLLYCLGPAGLVTGGTKENKCKDKVVVALVCNASGSDMRKPIVVGPDRKTCFSNGFNPSVYVDYYCDDTSMMTTGIFRQIVCSLDKLFRSQNRHCILVLDDLTSHAANTGLELTNLTLLLLPETTSSPLQPLDAGIIRAFKAHYRSLLVKHYLICADENLPLTVDLRQALSFVRRAWRNVSQSTVRNCWQRSKTLTMYDDDSVEDLLFEEDNIVGELQQLIDALLKDLEVTAADYVDIDKEEAICPPQTILNSVNLIKVEQTDNDDSVETVNIPESTVKSAREGLRSAIEYFEMLEDTDTLDELNEILDRIHSKFTPRSPNSQCFGKRSPDSVMVVEPTHVLPTSIDSN